MRIEVSNMKYVDCVEQVNKTIYCKDLRKLKMFSERDSTNLENPRGRSRPLNRLKYIYIWVCALGLTTSNLLQHQDHIITTQQNDIKDIHQWCLSVCRSVHVQNLLKLCFKQ